MSSESGSESHIVHEVIYLYFKGVAQRNDGPAGAGVIAEDVDTGKVFSISKSLGRRTNFQAEYDSLIFGLQHLMELENHEVLSLIILSNNEVVVDQLNGDSVVKNDKLLDLRKEAVELLKEFGPIQIENISTKKSERYKKNIEKAKELASKAIRRSDNSENND